MNTNDEHTNESNLARQHKAELGMDIPDGYFEASKRDILEAVSAPEVSVRRIFGLRPLVAYPVAASLVLLIGLLLYNRNPVSYDGPQLSVDEIRNEFPSEDALIASLLVDDAEVEVFVDEYLFNVILLESERSEQDLENTFMDSLFIEDSLLDDYVDKSLIDKVIL